MEKQGVIYEMSLRDMLTPGLESADRKANKLETTLKTVGKTVGVLFGAFEAFNFFKTSVEGFNTAAQASAQLDASLKSTGNAAGLLRSALDAQSAAVMNNSLFDDDAVTGAQSLLATFTQVKGSIYMDAIPAIADLATKMGTDLNSATLQVGKALNDPIAGITALKRSGVSFTQTQQDTIKSLVQTGHAAEAQKMILAELKTEFGGAAAAAAAAGTGPFTVLSHQFQNVKESIGGLLVKLLTGLLPAMRAGVALFSNMVNFIEKNAVLFQALGVALGVAAVAFIAVNIPMWLTAAAGWAVTASFGAISAVLMISPLGWFIGILAAAGAAFFYLWKKSETFRGAMYGLWEVIKGFAGSIKLYFTGLVDVLTGIFTFDLSKVKSGLGKVVEAYKGAAMDIKSNYEKGQKLGVLAFAEDNKPGAKKPGTQIGTAAAAAGLNTPAGKPGPVEKAGKVVGNKSVSVVVNIGDLIREYNVTTNNIQQAADRGRAIVAEALIAATNDFQLTAGQ